MEKKISTDRLKVFIESARLIAAEEIAELPPDKHEAVAGKAGLWIEVDCPEGSCSVDKKTITLPAGGVVPRETKGFWLNLFCPEDQCMITQSSDLP